MYVHMHTCVRTHTHRGISEAENQREKENLKTSGRKWNTKYKGTQIRISEDTLSEGIQIRERSNILEALKENRQPVVLYLVKIYFKNEGEMTATSKQKLENSLAGDLHYAKY